MENDAVKGIQGLNQVIETRGRERVNQDERLLVEVEGKGGRDRKNKERGRSRTW